MIKIKQEASDALGGLKTTLEGILIELKSGQRRSFDSSDFVIDEFRRLIGAILLLTAQLEKLPPP